VGDESIEALWTRGEWAAQAELTWRSGRTTKRVITFCVIHVPSDRRVVPFMSRADAHALVRWLARDVPHIDVVNERVEPADAWDRLREIVARVETARHYRMSVTALARDAREEMSDGG
jgi:hypothetical protein